MVCSVDPKFLNGPMGVEACNTIVSTSYKDPLLIHPPVFGCLCARDGVKTGPGCPNGQDAYDGKLVVLRNASA